MSATIANSFIFRESYFAEDMLQYQTPSRIDEDEDTNVASGIDYIRKYVEKLTADVSATTPAPNADSPLSSSPSHSLPSTSAASAIATPTIPTTTTTTTTTTTHSGSPATSASHAAIFAFNFASIQVSPPASNSLASSEPSDSSRFENELDLPRYLSWFDEDALASDDEDDGVNEEDEVIFYADGTEDDEDDEINNDADGDILMEEEEEAPLFAGQQAQLQIYEVTKKYKQSLTPDASLSSSPSSLFTALSRLAQHCALPIESPQYDTMKRKNSEMSSSKQESKKIKRCHSQ